LIINDYLNDKKQPAESVKSEGMIRKNSKFVSLQLFLLPLKILLQAANTSH